MLLLFFFLLNLKLLEKMQIQKYENIKLNKIEKRQTYSLKLKDLIQLKKTKQKMQELEDTYSLNFKN